MRAFLIVLVCLSSLFAHKLNIFLQQEENKVFVSAYYASGSFCKACKVEVSNKDKKSLQTGITNDKGEFVITKFDSSLDAVLYATVEAQGGHKVQSSIEIEALKEQVVLNEEPNELRVLQEENKALKREIKLLKDKNSLSDIFKMMLALLIMAGIFFTLKKLKKEEDKK